MPAITVSAPPLKAYLQPCPRCGSAVRPVLMLEHAIKHCPRYPARQHDRTKIVCLSSGRPSAQHDECAD